MKLRKKVLKRFVVEPGKKVDLSKFETTWVMDEKLMTDGGEAAVRERAAKILEENKAELSSAQELLWASNACAVLVIFQGMDAAGKDGTIKHVMSGVNPQGCKVQSFKVPTPQEMDHDFLWRYYRCLPGKGEIGIFNRSYYEDVLVPRVHPELLETERVPVDKRGEGLWKERFKDINAFERHLSHDGTLVLKFFLHISKAEQKKRLLDRTGDKDKYWKFSPADIRERDFWDEYVKAYEAVLAATSTKHAPWRIVPADHKWAARALVAEVIASEIRDLDLKYPEVTEEQLRAIEDARRELQQEK
jgi:PPK2 family polyphosphate:nucleotide phosphotransferase